MGATYLYGIIGGNDAASLGVPGIANAGPVRTVAADSLACLVSDYGGQELKALSTERLVRDLLAHQQVVEQVLGQHAVLPVKFGTVLAGLGEVLALLSQGREELLAALAAIQGKVEVEVAATWETGRVLQEVGREPGIVHAREAIARGDQPTLQERIGLGQMVKACIDRRRDGYRERMVASLMPQSIAVASNALLSEEMVMNVAFLVERARQHEFDEGVRALDGLFQGGINFRVIGPLPPYSFKTVRVTRLTRVEVEAARERLALAAGLSEAEVRRAYRRQAALEGRSLRPGDEGAGQRFKELNQAWELLTMYCRARQRAGDDAGCFFSVSIGGTQSDRVESARFGGSGRVA